MSLKAREELDQLMHQISEDYWSAGWLENLEVRLWTLLLGDAPNTPLIPEAVFERLDELSALAGGWFSFENKKKVEENNIDAYFVPMAEWVEEYARRMKPVPGPVEAEGTRCHGFLGPTGSTEGS